jgi:prenyltransferase beta subunit
VKVSPESIARAKSTLTRRLLEERNNETFWEGHLSSSAVSTAVAAFALARARGDGCEAEVDGGLRWLADTINADGGWGDTPESESNLSATLLSWSALSLVEGMDEAATDACRKAEGWLKRVIGEVEPRRIQAAVLAHYGGDRTFSAPILTMCALAGRLGSSSAGWRLVPQLPYELAIFPRGVFRWLRLSVVSYALPALIAIGLVRHHHRPSRNPLLRWLRASCEKRVLSILHRLQPPNGGFLEAPPLTGFVLMSLAAGGQGELPVASKAVDFLVRGVRADGSWPIDSNLSVWVTTLAINALFTGEVPSHSFTEAEIADLRDWILQRQYTTTHAFTGAEPGGWGWSHLPGAVPDADDTAGALLSLHHLGPAETRSAAARGVAWLLELRNRDGGIPTFCRGWGKLPFDRSCPDLTAHALRAFAVWRDEMDSSIRARIDQAISSGLHYLSITQRSDGSWVPLWFGNQRAHEKQNPLYGTAQVVTALRALDTGQLPAALPLLERGREWLWLAQNLDGGWGAESGTPSSIEETSLALSALAGEHDPEDSRFDRGLAWLIEHTSEGKITPATPIGLYFASLWYSEDLYPLIFALAAHSESDERQSD